MPGCKQGGRRDVCLIGHASLLPACSLSLPFGGSRMTDSTNASTTYNDGPQDDAKARFDAIRQISPYGAE